jgi:cell division protein ZapA
MAASSPKESVTVRIGGEDHTIRANVEPEYTRRCAKWVDDRISEIKSQLGLIESHKAAILAALSITDELFQAQEEAHRLKGAAGDKAKALASRLEGALAKAVDPETPAPVLEEPAPAGDPETRPDQPQLSLDPPAEPTEVEGEASVGTGEDEEM